MFRIRVAVVIQLLAIVVFMICGSVNSFRTLPQSRLVTTLHAAKTSSSDKIRVKLLTDVKGTGRYDFYVPTSSDSRFYLTSSSIRQERGHSVYFSCNVDERDGTEETGTENER